MKLFLSSLLLLASTAALAYPHGSLPVSLPAPSEGNPEWATPGDVPAIYISPLQSVSNLNALAHAQAEAVLKAMQKRTLSDKRRDLVCYEIGKLEAILQNLSLELNRNSGNRPTLSRLGDRFLLRSRALGSFCGREQETLSSTLTGRGSIRALERGSFEELRIEITRIIALSEEGKGTVGAGDSDKGTVGAGGDNDKGTVGIGEKGTVGRMSTPANR